jgi:hypothetical protein
MTKMVRNGAIKKHFTGLWRTLALVIGAACLSINFFTGYFSAFSVGSTGTLPFVPAQFSDATVAAGIHFTHFKGNSGTPTILEETGPGVCVSDYDGDGYVDIYFPNERDLYDRGIPARNALYHNNGDETGGTEAGHEVAARGRVNAEISKGGADR